MREYARKAGAADAVNREIYLDLRFMMTDSVLMKVDRMSMASSLEIRVPLLDHVLVSFLASLPGYWKLPRHQKKPVACTGIVTHQESIEMSDIEARVKKIVAEQLGVNEAEVKTASSFVDDLGADSLDNVELVMALEDEFGTEIPDEEAEKITTVQQAIDFVKAHSKS